MKPLETIRTEWGDDDFLTVPEMLVGEHTSSAVRYALCLIGLPVRPLAALKFNLRFESVQLEHHPNDVRLLLAGDFTPGSPSPGPGSGMAIDVERIEDRLLVIGEGPNGFTGTWHSNRFICIDNSSGKVCWVYAKLDGGRVDAWPINSSIHAYLGSLLAYKKFRDQWPALMEKYSGDSDEEEEDDDDDRSEYKKEAGAIYEQFQRDLEEADPDGFKDGFWEEHAGNEAILFEI